MMRFDDLRLLLSRGATDKRSLYYAIQQLPPPSEIPLDIIEQIAELVPQISELLSLSTQLSVFRDYHFDLVSQVDDLVDGELNHYFFHIECKVCYLLAHLGIRAQAAVPALLAHVEKYPRFKHNVRAIGKIGGPGVVRRLIQCDFMAPYEIGGPGTGQRMIQWDCLDPYEFDEECYEVVCEAIRCLGATAIEELLAIASPSNLDAHERMVALLNLVDYTAYPPELSIPLIASELDRLAGTDSYARSRELLRDRLIWLSSDNAQSVVTAIEPWLMSAKSEATDDFIYVLSELGAVAIPLLKKAVEESGNGAASIDALVKIGGEGLEYIYSFITTSQNKQLLPNAVRSIPLDDLRSLEILNDLIETKQSDWQHWGLLRRMAVRRLSEFTDHQETIKTLLGSFQSDPDEHLVRAAEAALNKIADRANHPGR